VLHKKTHGFLLFLGLAVLCAGILLSVLLAPLGAQAAPTPVKFVTKEIPYFQPGHYVVQPYEPPVEKLTEVDA